MEKTGGEVYYPDGRNIFPIKYDDLTMEGSKLLMKFNIASAKSVKEEIMKQKFIENERWKKYNKHEEME